MPTYTPADDRIGPIIHEIATIIQAQIPSIATVYERMPDRQPIDNSVVIPLSKARVKDNTNGKLQVNYTFGVKHLFKRKQMADNILQAYSYVTPWLMMLSSWTNSDLGGLSRDINISDLQVIQVTESGQVMIALAVTFDVCTEYNIPLV